MSRFLFLFCSTLLSTPLFESITSKLNVEPVILTPDTLPYSHGIDDNLVQLYAQEMSGIKTGLPKKTSREEKNKFIAEKIEVLNKASLAPLGSPPMGTPKGKIQVITSKVFEELKTNKVSQVDAVGKYDSRGDIGFCFGRAVLVHYLLLSQGIPQNQIAKIFALGKLRYRETLWDFHMATMVKGEDKWWVIDSLFEKPLPHTEWVQRVSGFDSKRKHPHVRFSVTDPRKFQPSYGRYHADYFLIPDLVTYFTELFKSVQKHIDP